MATELTPEEKKKAFQMLENWAKANKERQKKIDEMKNKNWFDSQKGWIKK